MLIKQRVFLIVLDSFGIGAAPDAAEFGDAGCHTLKACLSTGQLRLSTMTQLGLFHIEGLAELAPEINLKPLAMHGRMQECSRGKDTTVGHWEIAGVPTNLPLPTYPNGFPPEILSALQEQTGLQFLCNLPYSGTDVIRDYGEAHLRTGNPILYTSADSVMQIAAHEDCIPTARLYEICEIARSIMCGAHAVGRIIARPFTGTAPFVRTPHRHDFSAPPPKKTMLDLISEQGLDVIGIGKIHDIFAGQGLTRTLYTGNNTEGMQQTERCLQSPFHGLCFVNLVDFDMLYGHRNDPVGYTHALNAFDTWLGRQLPLLQPGDALLITADHGCDPAFAGTDHTREFTPMLLYGSEIPPLQLGTRNSFSDIAKTVCRLLGVPEAFPGSPFPFA